MRQAITSLNASNKYSKIFQYYSSKHDKNNHYRSPERLKQPAEINSKPVQSIQSSLNAATDEKLEW